MSGDNGASMLAAHGCRRLHRSPQLFYLLPTSLTTRSISAAALQERASLGWNFVPRWPRSPQAGRLSNSAYVNP